MADERMSDGELRHRFDSIDKRFESVDRRVDRMATVDMVTSETSHTRDRIAEVDRDSRERDDDIERATDARFKRNEERNQMTRGQVITVLVAVATVLATIVGAYISTKGIK